MGHPVTCHRRHREGIDVYLFLTSTIDGVQRHASTALPPGKRPGMPFTKGAVVMRAGLKRYEEEKISCSIGARTSDLPAPSRYTTCTISAPFRYITVRGFKSY
jgi:hypothetical protein